MLEPSEMDSPVQEDFSVQFSIKLVVVAEVPDMQGKKGKPKTTKETKNKMFLLMINKCTSSYEKSIQAIVDNITLCSGGTNSIREMLDKEHANTPVQWGNELSTPTATGQLYILIPLLC
jgi:hypothetical protein